MGFYMYDGSVITSLMIKRNKSWLVGELAIVSTIYVLESMGISDSLEPFKAVNPSRLAIVHANHASNCTSLTNNLKIERISLEI